MGVCPLLLSPAREMARLLKICLSLSFPGGQPLPAQQQPLLQQRPFLRPLSSPAPGKVAWQSVCVCVVAGHLIACFGYVR